jgi:23S rRNA-/tRNA-specific pseudouridylate synthase
MVEEKSLVTGLLCGENTPEDPVTELEREIQESGVRTAEGRIGHCRSGDEFLIECVVRHFGLTEAEVQSLIAFGAVYVDRRRTNSNSRLISGQSLRVHIQPKRFPVQGIDWRAVIVAAEDEFLVVNKPPGIPVHATLDNQFENVLHELHRALGVPVYVTQRLDGDVSGLMVVAKTRQFQRLFNGLLVERKVKKRYRALVTSPPEIGRHVHYMEPAARSPRTVVAEHHAEWLRCALSVEYVQARGERFDVEIDLETGRTHQIRAQLAAMGSPIVGDGLYGSSQSGPIRLFSAAVSWIGDGGKERRYALSPPWHQDDD